jgi:bifunctional UDP-N-acetylglucosamine pyrophosphorylase/glucosamine-1-phosphate N-acetyltransferase
MKAAVLAAGKGTRLQTEGINLPKVLRLADGKPLLSYVLSELSFLPREDVILIVGYKRDMVEAAFPGYPFAVQEQQLGTGHAVACAGELLRGYDGPLLVCCGDMPLMTEKTYRAVIAAHEAEGNVCTILAATCDRDLPYGRVLRRADGTFDRVVEDRDCTPEQKKIRELNAGVYVFDCRKLLSVLGRLKCDNAQGEYYLTDAPALLREGGGRIGVCAACTADEMLGVNTPEQLAQVESYLKGRK